MTPTRTIAVAGAGLGGLTAALALAAQGYRVVLLEKAERLDQIGAGLQLSPNASRVLVELGVGDAIAARATAPDAVSIMSARAGGEVARLPLQNAAFRFGAPYLVMHRADLQAALVEAVQNHPDIDLRLGWTFEDAASHAHGITVVARHDIARDTIAAVALIGADGVWSSVRHRLFPQVQPQFTGLIAWRGTIDARQLPRELAAPRVQLWMGRDAHLVVYPIAGGSRVNIVAIVRGTWNSPGWSAPGDAATLRSLFAARHWPGPARMTIGAVDEFRRYALFEMPDGGVWQQDCAALLGDAAHAMLPFAAQGAGMAIEDAAVLAKCLGPAGSADAVRIAAALARYAGIRKTRIARVQRIARRNGRIYHLGGLAALARDTAIRLRGGQSLLARQDWIYDWRA